jgi:predicted PurR-regulated permease PerM
MVSFIVLVAIIVVIGFLFYRVMAPFLLPMFLAALLVVLFHPLHRWVVQKFNGRQRLAAITTTASVLFVVLFPILLTVILAASESSVLVGELSPSLLGDRVAETRDRFELLRMENAATYHRIEELFASLSSGPASELDELTESRRTIWKWTVAQLRDQVDELRNATHTTSSTTANEFDALQKTLEQLADDQELDPWSVKAQAVVLLGRSRYRTLKLDLLGGQVRMSIKQLANPTDERIGKLFREGLEYAKGTLFSIGGKTTAAIGRLVVGLVIMVVSMYFFLTDGPGMVNTLMRLSPLDDEYETELLADFETVSRAVVLATLLSALAQGLLAGFGYWIAGLNAVFLLMMLTTVLAMIPFVGSAAVWVPCCLWLYFFEDRLGAAIFLAIWGGAVVSTIDNVIKPFVLHGQSRLHPLLALLSVLGGVNALGPIGILVGPMVVAFLQTLLNILHRELMRFDSEQPSSTVAGDSAAVPD